MTRQRILCPHMWHSNRYFSQHMIFWYLSHCRVPRLRRACAHMQTRQSLHSSKIWHSHCQHEILVPLLHCRVTNDSILEPWRICTFTQVHASLRQRTKISYTFMRASSPELSSLDNAISNKNLTCWLKWRFGGHYDSVRVAKTLASLHI